MTPYLPSDREVGHNPKSHFDSERTGMEQPNVEAASLSTRISTAAKNVAEMLSNAGVLYAGERVVGITDDEQDILVNAYKVTTLLMTDVERRERSEATANNTFSKTDKDPHAIPIIGNFIRNWGIDDVVGGIFNAVIGDIPMFGPVEDRATVRALTPEQFNSPLMQRAIEKRGLTREQFLRVLRVGTFSHMHFTGLREVYNEEHFDHMVDAAITPANERASRRDIVRALLSRKIRSKRSLAITPRIEASA